MADFLLKLLLITVLSSVVLSCNRRVKTNSAAKTDLFIYQGEGACLQCTHMVHTAFSDAADRGRHNVRLIKPAEIIEGSWRQSAALIAFPGGYTSGFIKTLGDEGAKQVRDYVNEGGSFIGFCAGGYYGCDYTEFDKGGPDEIVGEKPLKFYPGKCVGPTFPGFDYTSNEGVHAALISTQHKMEPPFHVYFNGGFNLLEPITDLLVDQDEDIVNTWNFTSKYLDLEGEPNAVAYTNSGKGRTVLTGVHFEFDPYLIPEGDPIVDAVLPDLKKGDKQRRHLLRESLQYLGVYLRQL